MTTISKIEPLYADAANPCKTTVGDLVARYTNHHDGVRVEFGHVVSTFSFKTTEDGSEVHHGCAISWEIPDWKAKRSFRLAPAPTEVKVGMPMMEVRLWHTIFGLDFAPIYYRDPGDFPWAIGKVSSREEALERARIMSFVLHLFTFTQINSGEDSEGSETLCLLARLPPELVKQIHAHVV